jgi:hypothetical protein
MRIGRLEIRWLRRGQAGCPPAPQPGWLCYDTDDVDRVGALAVPDTEAWWLAVHQIVNSVEKETIDSSRKRVANTNLCISDVGAGEGVALVRTRLIEARQLAIQVRKDRMELKQYSV